MDRPRRRAGLDRREPARNQVQKGEIEIPPLDPERVYLVKYRVYGTEKIHYTSTSERYKHKLIPWIHKKHHMDHRDKLEFVEFVKEGFITH